MGDVTKYKAVEGIEVSVALAKLVIEKEKARYEKELHRIHEREAKKKAKK